MNELKIKVSAETKEARKELNEIEKQVDRIIEKMKSIKIEQKGGN